MTKYFLGLIVIAFVGSVVMSLSPKGTSRAYLKLLCGLCSIGCIAIPLISAFSGGGFIAEDFIDAFDSKNTSEDAMIEIYNDAIEGAAIKNAEQTLKNEIIKELSAKNDSIDVKIITDNNSEDFYIKVISVTIYPSGYTLNPREISSICVSRLGAECEFVYK